MSGEDLARAILAEHCTNYGPQGWVCECGHRYGQPLNVESSVEIHRLMSAVAAVREQVAREIEVPVRQHDRAQIGFSAVGDAYAHAARIARGEQS